MRKATRRRRRQWHTCAHELVYHMKEAKRRKWKTRALERRLVNAARGRDFTRFGVRRRLHRGAPA